MRAVDLIRKKRDSGEHSREELEFLISGYTKRRTATCKVPYQARTNSMQLGNTRARG